MKILLKTTCAIGVMLGLTFAGACRRSEGGSAPIPPATGFPATNAITAAPLGQVAGASGNVMALSIANPFEGNPQAVEQGKQLYIKMNCAGCHAYNGKGNMGPDLTDTYWRYGGLPVQIYQSIQEGRPQGMPSWGRALPPDDIWKLVAYIESFGGSAAAKDYKHARQGDQPGEQTAPEALEQTP
jgi:cytochrome c oxidase cbb3-type subunit 3